MTDLRTRNDYPQGSSAAEYFRGYLTNLSEALLKVSTENLERVFTCLREARTRNARIYVAGNGGSCAIAAHLCCDWMKGTQAPHLPPLKVVSLMENVSVLSALANDLSYEESVAEQIRYLGEAGDVLLLISSSGNSPNILAAAKTAKEKKMTILGFTGFKGGKLSEIADISLHVPADNYGVAEDAHQVIMHVLAQYMYLDASRTQKK